MQEEGCDLDIEVLIRTLIMPCANGSVRDKIKAWERSRPYMILHQAQIGGRGGLGAIVSLEERRMETDIGFTIGRL